MSQQPLPNQPNPAPAGPNGLTSDEVTWAVVSHISVLIATLISVGTVGWAVPLILYLVHKDKSPFIRQASAGALNFAITTFIANVVASTLFFIGITLGILIVPLILCVLGALIWAALFVIVVVVPILATVAANRGEAYTYPMTIRFFR